MSPVSTTASASSRAAVVERFTENVYSFVNTSRPSKGGTHVSGFRTALTRCLNNYSKKANLVKDLIPTGEDFREGLTAIISVPCLSAVSKPDQDQAPATDEIEGIVNSAVGDFLNAYLEENRAVQIIVQKACWRPKRVRALAKARLIGARAQGRTFVGRFPGKLRDCTSRDVEKCELYLVGG